MLPSRKLSIDLQNHHLIWLVVSNLLIFPFYVWDVILPIDESSIILQDCYFIAPPSSDIFILFIFGVPGLRGSIIPRLRHSRYQIYHIEKHGGPQADPNFGTVFGDFW